MENNESGYYRGDGASRPPMNDSSAESGDSAFFTELPSDSFRRTPTSGGGQTSRRNTTGNINNTTARRAANSAPQTGRTAPRAVPYTPQSRSYPSDSRTSQSRPTYGGSAPTFTEISWDSLRGGSPGQSAQNTPQQPASRTPSYARQQPYPTGSNGTERRVPYAAQGYTEQRSRPAAQPAEYEQPDPFYGGAPQRETAERRAYNAPQRSHGDYYRSGAIHRPTQRTGTQRPASPRKPNGGGGARPPRRPHIKLRFHPAVYVGALVLVILLIVGVVKLVQKSNEKPLYALPSYAPVTATPLPTSSPAPEEAEKTATAEETPTPRPTAEPTPTPTGAKAQRKGTLIVPADWGAVVPERTSAVYDSYFDRSVMIGNSLVEGFFMWSGMTNIRYIYSTGAVVSNVIGVLDLSPLTLNESTYYNDIYLMFGLNEVGTDVNSFVQSYKELIEYVREYQTEANIYVISVTPVTRDVDADPNEVQSMDRIDTFNAALKQLCVDENCWYLDIYSMLLDETGYLSADYAYAGDGKHFEKSGYVAWANYMKTHYVDEGLLTE